MSAKLVRNVFSKSELNNYLVGGNVCNAFALGDIGSADDFFLIGAEPEPDSGYPMLTGNFLDSEGNVLFRLVRNILVLNPGHCSKVRADLTGYEINDSAGKLILKVQTRFIRLPGEDAESWVTTVAGQFYDRKRIIVCSTGDDGDGFIEASCKFMFGTGGIVGGMDEEEAQRVTQILALRGIVHKVIMGPVENQTLELDGTALIKTTLRNCKLVVRTGEFVGIDSVRFENCKFHFEGPAGNLRFLFEAIQKSTVPPPLGIKEDLKKRRKQLARKRNR